MSSEARGPGAWKIGRRGHGCAACAAAFDDGAMLFSTLVVSEESLARVDRCASCHAKRERSDGEIQWRTRYHAAPKKARIDLVGLVEVFRKLLESADAKIVDLRYLIALLLLRHRKLRLVSTRTQGERDFLVVAFSRARATHDVEVSDLPKERVDALREELAALFVTGASAGGASGAGAVTPSADAAEARPNA